MSEKKKKPPRIKVEVRPDPKLKKVTAVKGLNRGEQEEFKQRIKQRRNGYCSPTVRCGKNNEIVIQGNQVADALNIISQLSIPSADIEVLSPTLPALNI
jgi:translation initiation factor 1 (eIF-1/SUI1)